MATHYIKVTKQEKPVCIVETEEYFIIDRSLSFSIGAERVKIFLGDADEILVIDSSGDKQLFQISDGGIVCPDW